MLCFIDDKVDIRIFRYAFVLEKYLEFIVASILGALVIILFSVLFLNKESCFSRISRYGILLLGVQFFGIRPFSDLISKMGKTFRLEYDVLMLFITSLYITVTPYLY